MLKAIALVLIILCWHNAAAADNTIFDKVIQEQTGKIPRAALDSAFAYFREHADQIKNKNYITLIDFDQPSTAKRMHVIDLKTGAVEDLLVAHGQNSGENYATKFSNEVGSYQSSLGIYLIDQPTMTRKRGMALLLDGMEETNNRARRREIILHGATYVSEKYIADNGRLGRSLGCPAVEMSVIDRLIGQLKGGSVMLIYKSSGATTKESDAPVKATPGEESAGK